MAKLCNIFVACVWGFFDNNVYLLFPYSKSCEKFYSSNDWFKREPFSNIPIYWIGLCHTNTYSYVMNGTYRKIWTMVSVLLLSVQYFMSCFFVRLSYLMYNQIILNEHKQHDLKYYDMMWQSKNICSLVESFK